MINKDKPLSGQNMLTPKNTYAVLEDIFEPKGINGKKDSRWDLSKKKVLKVFEKLCDSILKNGFLAGVIAIKVPRDITLLGHFYKKGSWLAVDINGRMQCLKHCVALGATLNEGRFDEVTFEDVEGKIVKGKINMEGKVPVLDVSDSVFVKGDEKVDEQVLFKLWCTLIRLNTGNMDWDDFDFLSSGARVMIDTEQKEIWTYLSKQMEDYSVGKKSLTYPTILAATIGSLSDTAKLNAHINFNMKFKRYTDLILKRLKEIHKKSKYTRQTFIKELAHYFRVAARSQCFVVHEYDKENKPKKDNKGVHIIHECFDWAGDVYEDSHFDQFKKYIDYISDWFGNRYYPEGFDGGAKGVKQIHDNVLDAWEKYKNNA